MRLWHLIASGCTTVHEFMDGRIWLLIDLKMKFNRGGAQLAKLNTQVCNL